MLSLLKNQLKQEDNVQENSLNTDIKKIRKRFCENYHKTFNFDLNGKQKFKGRPRLIEKCGELNIDMHNVPKHKRRLLSDFFNTILDIKWRWHVVIFIFTFVVSWFLFATVWYLIAFTHGDIDIDHQNNETSPCIFGVDDFTSALLYSIETQHTIGYGYRHITETCTFAIIFLMLQSCFGIFIQGLVAGVVFAKLSRPNKRKRTIIFSNNAVIAERDGRLCFLFKIGNIRISQLSDAKIKLLMIKSRRTSEGEFIPFQTFEMKVGYEWSGNENIFFPWPKIVEHVIDENSPLYEIYLENLNEKRSKLAYSGDCEKGLVKDLNSNLDYEIVVILEGNIETTGASCHIRTSYLPNEILWGYRFIPIYPTFTDCGYLFDYSKFNQVEPVHDRLFHINMKHFFNYVLKTENELKNGDGSSSNSISNKSSLSSQLSIRSGVNREKVFKLENMFLNNHHQNCGISSVSGSIGRTRQTGRFTIVPVDQCDNSANGSCVGSFSYLDEGYLTSNQVITNLET